MIGADSDVAFVRIFREDQLADPCWCISERRQSQCHCLAAVFGTTHKAKAKWNYLSGISGHSVFCS